MLYWKSLSLGYIKINHNILESIKMKELFSIFLVIGVFSQAIASNILTDSCAISINYSVNFDCSEADSTLTLISVSSENACSNFYEVFQNGNPVAIRPYGNINDTIRLLDQFGNNTLTVCDTENPDCCDTLIINTDCACAIYEMEASITNCIDSLNQFWLSVDFEHVFTGESFELGGSGQNFGIFDYDDLPIEIGPLDLDIGTFEIAAFDLDDPFCFGFTDVDSIEACPNICFIENLFAEAQACNDNDEVFVDFEFDIGNQSGFFEARINNIAVDTFEYGSTSYTVGPIDFDCQSNTVLSIHDLIEADCNESFTLTEIICCDPIPECGLSSFIVMPTECDANGNFGITFTFEHEEGVSDSFLLEMDSVIVETYAYGDTLYTYEGLFGDCVSNFRFILRDQETQNCRSNFALLLPVCCQLDTCMIDNLFAEAQACDSLGNFLLDFEFEAVNPLSDSFELSLNGSIYDTLPYGELFYTLGPLAGDCETNYEISVQDLDDPACLANFALDNIICCPADMDTCQITNIIFETTECDTFGNFNVDFELIVQDSTSGQFVIVSNGLTIDTLDYSLPTYSVGPFQGDCETIYEFVIRDLVDTTCQLSFVLDEPVCCDSDMDGCEIFELVFEPTECTETGEFNLEFELMVENPASDQFVFESNNMVIDTFEYELPSYSVGPFDGDCETIYEFVIRDLIDPTCQASIVLNEPVCCEMDCNLSLLDYDILCTEGEADYFIAVYLEADTPSDSVRILDDFVLLDVVAYQDTAIILGPFSDQGIIAHNFLFLDQSELCGTELNIADKACITNTEDPSASTAVFSVINNRIIFEATISIEQLELFDMNGRLLLDYREAQPIIELNHLPTGIYILRYQIDGLMVAKKLIKY